MRKKNSVKIKIKSKNKTKAQYVLALDLGGTKIAAGLVDSKGRIHHQLKVPVQTSHGPNELLRQIVGLCRELIKLQKPKAVVIASAGPLDPVSGKLLNPTNLKSDGKEWGVVNLTSSLAKKLKLKVLLENDAAAALLAERWLGAGRGVKNFAVVTLGTGLGVAVQTQGVLVRAGRHLHTEMGHILMDPSIDAPICGCGNRGCAEALVSGVNFTRRLQKLWGQPNLTGEELVQLAQNGNKQAIQAFESYATELARFLCSLVVVFAPEKIILSGGFSHAYELFEKSLTEHLLTLLSTRRSGVDMMPKIVVSKFRDEAGVLGAASIGLLS